MNLFVKGLNSLINILKKLVNNDENYLKMMKDCQSIYIV